MKFYEKLLNVYSFRNGYGQASPENIKTYCPISATEGYLLSVELGIVYINGPTFKTVAPLEPAARLPLYLIKNNKFYVQQGNYFIEFDKGRKTNARFKIEGKFSERWHEKKASVPAVVYASTRDSIVCFFDNSMYVLTLSKQKMLCRKEFTLENQEISSALHLPECDTYLLGTMNDGMLVLRKKRFTTFFTSPTHRESNNYYAQMVLDDNRLLTHLSIIDIRNKKIIKPVQALNRYSLLLNSKGQLIYSVYEHEKDVVIFSDKNLNELETYPIKGDVRGITEDSEGNIWMGRLRSLYVIYADKKVEQLAELPTFIEVILPLPNKKLWLGTRKGMYEYDIDSRQATLLKGTEHLYIRNMYRSKDGNLWIGCYGQGFYLYQNQRFIKLPLDQYGYLSTAHCFIEDDKGFVWIPTNNGLFRTLLSELYLYAEGKTQEVYYYYYDKRYGFNTNEFNGGCTPCSAALGNGNISLPSLNGLVWFNPSNIPPIKGTPEIVIDRIWYNKGKQTAAEDKQLLSFPDNTNEIYLEVYSPFFGDKKNRQLEYRLSTDSGWKKIDQNLISFSNLSSGQYELQIRNRIGFRSSDFVLKKLNFQIAPKWYEQNWFRLLVILLLIGLGTLISGIRTRIVRGKNKLLEQEVKKRTEELNKAMEDLSKTVTELQASQKEVLKSNDLKDKLTSVLAHDLKSSIRFTSTLSSHLSQQLATMSVGPKIKNHACNIARATNETYLFIDEFLLWINSHKSGGYKAQLQLLDISTMFNELSTFFEDMVRQNHNTISFEAKKKSTIYTDPQIVKIIVRNLIDNSNKYTRNGSIKVSAVKENNSYIFSVQDTGRGIAAETIERLNAINRQTAFFTTHGLGYQIIMDIRRLIHAEIKIESELNKGTTVYVTVPI
ncbi:MAG: ATP-binding protein [Agriterribacter sp.]